jgi:hypothetical protein
MMLTEGGRSAKVAQKCGEGDGPPAADARPGVEGAVRALHGVVWQGRKARRGGKLGSVALGIF